MMILCYELKKLLIIPVSPSLIVIGVLLRVLGPYLGQMELVEDLIIGIKEEVINLVFFPILIFSASFSANWYTIKKELFQIMLLATSVVGVNTYLTACTFKYILGYTQSWGELLTLGVILSATDHIAVDSVLKEIICSDKLETLMGGETMFNEATVLVLFKVLNTSDASIVGIANSFALFSRLAFGGFFMGIAVALAAGVILRRMLSDFVQETNTCFVVAYLLYWMCNISQINVSGALALVAYGLYLSAYEKTLISPDVSEKLKSILEIGSRNVESLIFIIAGILIGNSTFYGSGLTNYDYLTLFLLFPLTYVIRFVSLLIHYPLLRYTGYGLGRREFIALVFAGIKGVISTALALIVFHDSGYTDKYKSLVVYFGIGTAGLTIILGGTALKLVVKLLGLEDMTEVQENMLAGITSALVEASEHKLQEIYENKDMKLIHWDYVLKIAGPLPLVKSVLGKSKAGLAILKDHADTSSKDLLKMFSSRFKVSKAALKIEMRRRYLSTLKGIYLHLFEIGMCHGDTSLILIDSCNMSLDNENEPMEDWEIVRKIAYVEYRIKLETWLSRCKGIGALFRRSLYSKIILAYDAAHNFIKSHQDTEELMDKMEINIDKSIFDEIIQESYIQVQKCEEFLKTYIIDCYPEVLAEVQTKRSSTTLLYFQKKIVDKIFEQGLIKDLEHQKLKDAIGSSIREVTFKGLPSLPLLQEILKNRFSTAEVYEIEYLASIIIEKAYKPGEIIFQQGEPADGAYIVIRGRVNEYSAWVDQEHIIGNIVGVQHLLHDFCQINTSSSKSLTLCVLAHIPKEVLNIKGIIDDIYKEASEEIMLLHRSKFELDQVEEKHVLRVAAASNVLSYRKGKKVSFPDGCLVFNGKVYEKQKKFFIKPSNKTRDIFEDCIVMVFPPDFSLCFEGSYQLSDAFKNFCVKNSIQTSFTKELVLEDYECSESRLEDSGILLTGVTDEKMKINQHKKYTKVVPTDYK